MDQDYQNKGTNWIQPSSMVVHDLGIIATNRPTIRRKTAYQPLRHWSIWSLIQRYVRQPWRRLFTKNNMKLCETAHEEWLWFDQMTRICEWTFFPWTTNLISQSLNDGQTNSQQDYILYWLTRQKNTPICTPEKTDCKRADVNKLRGGSYTLVEVLDLLRVLGAPPLCGALFKMPLPKYSAMTENPSSELRSDWKNLSWSFAFASRFRFISRTWRLAGAQTGHSFSLSPKHRWWNECMQRKWTAGRSRDDVHAVHLLSWKIRARDRSSWTSARMVAVSSYRK